ncbi:MAG: S1C family serine protease [Pseudomonadota bacterium]|nr:S1C family serine protease [Pseudomonadota bacterium]
MIDLIPHLPFRGPTQLVRLLLGAVAAVGTVAVLATAAAAAEAATGSSDLPPRSAAEPDLARRQQALARAGAAVVGIEVTAVEHASSIETLGRARSGSGVVIDGDGLVLTIGYLVLEADHVDLLLEGPRRVPARVVAYDVASGFGLLQALAPLLLQPAPLGNSSAVAGDDPLLIASGGPDGDLSVARMVSRRPYSAYWEYHLDDALFTAPARIDHSGAGLFNADGELIGIGSLVVSDAAGTAAPPLRGNMFVPVDLLKPILAELRSGAVASNRSRAWLGLSCVEFGGHLRVLRLAPSGPAHEAGLQPGDLVIAIDGVEVSDLRTFYKTLWRAAPAARAVALEVRRGRETMRLNVQAVDRMTTLRRPQGI